MSRPSVLVTRRIPSSILTKLEALFEVDLHNRGDFSHEDLIARVRGKQGLLSVVTDAIDRAVLDAGRDLRIVSTIAVGYNNIDLEAARERNIIVTNTPDVLNESTADLTWSLILGIMRRIVEGDRLVRRGQWKGFALDFMLGSDLRGKQLGIIGFGRIGQAVAARAPAFGMRVAYTGRSPKPGVEAEFMPLEWDPLESTCRHASLSIL